MKENIEYIVNQRGVKIKAVIPLELLDKLLSQEGSGAKKMNREEIKKYIGSVKLTVDPMNNTLITNDENLLKIKELKTSKPKLIKKS